MTHIDTVDNKREQRDENFTAPILLTKKAKTIFEHLQYLVLDFSSS